MTRAKSAAAEATAPAASARLVKIGPTGAELAADVAEWEAVLDRRTGLMWAREPIEVPNWKKPQVAKTEKAIGELAIGGFTDWRIPTVDALFTLADRSRVSPAIDVDFFPDCPSDWFWTSTPYAPSPGDYAWFVDFDGGDAYYDVRDGRGFVRAVRASQ